MNISLQIGAVLIQSVVRTLPDKPGVYRMLGENDAVLYVGKAKSLKKRVVSYTQVDKLPNRLQRMVSETKRMEIVTTQSETEALLLESNLIKKLQPHYNILLKDDKSFPFIIISSNHPYPRVIKHRGTQSIPGTYFGPFASIAAVEECLIMIQKVFLVRNCTDAFFSARTRPCLQYHIKRCSAPCVKKIAPSDYAQSIQLVQDFLSGKSAVIQKILAEKMQGASDEQRYEEAASYRDRIQLLTRLQSHQRINHPGIQDADVFAIAEKGPHTCVQIFFFRQGQNFGTHSLFLSHTQDSTLEERLQAFIPQFYEERKPAPLVLLSHTPLESGLITQALSQKYALKMSFETPKRGVKKDLIDHALSNAYEALERRYAETATAQKLLDDIAAAFQMETRQENPIRRIEIYDNSHLQGTNPYGVMVVADEAGFNKKAYRKFSIREEAPAQGGDDFAMMREVMLRRFSHQEWPKPDLMLIDGGLGQLNATLSALYVLGIEGVTVVGIAKGEDRNAGRERFFLLNKAPFSMPHNSAALHYLQRLRDEAHRFAIGTHRAGRQKKMLKSQIDDIPGIGPKRKKALLQHFGSAKAVALASLQDLQNVSGIDLSVAEKIYGFFHER